MSGWSRAARSGPEVRSDGISYTVSADRATRPSGRPQEPKVRFLAVPEQEGWPNDDEQEAWRESARFFREGGVGKNRARLSAEQEARIVERARREFEPACFDFLMSLGA